MINNEEDKKLKVLGDNIDAAQSKLNSILFAHRGKNFDYDNDSIHLLIWSIISQRESIKRILEIGTSDGEGTLVLAKLFPVAEIVTIDLPDNDPLLRVFYKRETNTGFNSYLEKQKTNLKHKNVHPIKVNSFFLQTKVTGQFDLIWVDGGHLYPEVAWDICNAWNLCSTNGFILCDDIIPKKSMYKTKYISSESYAVLNYLNERVQTRQKLFLKRRKASLYPSTLTRKYVALLQKIMNEE